MTTGTDLGAAHDEPVVVRRRLSPSRASDFLTCPLLFRYRTIDRLPEPPSPVAARGTLVHAVLEDLFDQPAERRTPEVAQSLVPAAWERVVADDARLVDLFTAPEAVDPERDAWFASVDALLETYFRLENPQTLEPAEREVRVEGAVDDRLVLAGIVDRIDVAPDGRIRIVDYKSGRSPGERYEDKALFQMKFYALVVWRTRGVMPSLLQLMYLGDGQVLRYVPTEPDLLATERKLLAIWSAIDAALAAGDFRPRPSGLCRFCAHRDLCPEGGGQVLPMPTTRLEPLG
ncbi:PD-(D/E)XK nuclease family protein [Aeromicrobium sp. Leaf350]|uniref:RecB family exonuclease n=1 Tax=Aeromicrobium sp. Leaf350 TaxID=2876565 RepID=UPI001E5C374C|nr:PD-(D/E)XK nuclease family protein [Aeromicrobium sp. Leaf350]